MSAKISWGLQISQDSKGDAVNLLCDNLMVSSLTQQMREIHGISSAQDPRNLFLTSQKEYSFNREKIDS